MRAIDWRPWLDALAADQAFYFANAYAVEFLKRNLTRERLDWFHAELGRVAAPDERARAAAAADRPRAWRRRSRSPRSTRRCCGAISPTCST